METSDLAVEIGRRIRRHRTAAGLSGRELANASGLSQPFLSQLETGQTSLAIASLYRLASALGVRPSDLLPDAREVEIEVVRHSEMQRWRAEDDDDAAEAFAVVRGGRAISEFYDYVIEPGQHAGGWFSSDSDHVLYVIAGSVLVEFEDRATITLDEGDVLFYPSTIPHRWRHVGHERARVVLVTVDAGA